MELVTFESKAYQELVEKINRIAKYVLECDSLSTEKKQAVWLDSNEVAELLKISTRTLQRLRKDNLISYTMLRGKCLYKLSDIENSLQERIIPTDQKTLDDIRKKYLFKGFASNM